MERKYFNINFKVDNTTEKQEAKNQEISNMGIEVKNQRPNANELFRKAINGSSRQATNAESEEHDLWDVTANETLKRGAAMKDPIPLYEPFWYEGEIGILFAKSNVGKSTLAVQIADAISKQGKTVYYLDYEQSEKQFQLRYTNKETKEIYEFSEEFKRPRLIIELSSGEETAIARFFKMVKKKAEQGGKIFILDNITFLISKIENGADIIAFMKRLKNLKEEYGLSFLILAHTTKTKDAKPITQDDLAGSKKLMNFTDSAFAMGKSRVDGSIYLKQIKARMGSIVYHEDNVLVGGLVNDNNFLHFEDYGTATEESLLKKSNKAVSDPTKIEDIEHAYTLHSKEGLSNRQIAKELGVSDKTIGKWIRQYESILARSTNV